MFSLSPLCLPASLCLSMFHYLFLYSVPIDKNRCQHHHHVFLLLNFAYPEQNKHLVLKSNFVFDK